MPLALATAERLATLLTPNGHEPLDLGAFLVLLADRKYSGSLILHFSNGTPKLVELPAPKIPIR